MPDYFFHDLAVETNRRRNRRGSARQGHRHSSSGDVAPTRSSFVAKKNSIKSDVATVSVDSIERSDGRAINVTRFDLSTDFVEARLASYRSPAPLLSVSLSSDANLQPFAHHHHHHHHHHQQNPDAIVSPHPQKRNNDPDRQQPAATESDAERRHVQQLQQRLEAQSRQLEQLERSRCSDRRQLGRAQAERQRLQVQLHLQQAKFVGNSRPLAT